MFDREERDRSKINSLSTPDVCDLLGVKQKHIQSMIRHRIITPEQIASRRPKAIRSRQLLTVYWAYRSHQEGQSWQDVRDTFGTHLGVPDKDKQEIRESSKWYQISRKAESKYGVVFAEHGIKPL